MKSFFNNIIKIIKDIMAQFTTTNLPPTSVPPNSIGDITLSTNGGVDLILTESTFTTNTTPPYSHPNGNAPYQLKILTLPASGEIQFDNVAMGAGDILTFSDLNTYVLKYVPSIIITSDHTVSFTFEVSDTGSQQFFGTGTVTINVLAMANQPPTVGDGTATINYGETKVFTPADFTTNTTPPYVDPEGDSPAYLKIITLPNIGGLFLNGVPVVLNQEISFSDIASGALTQTGDPNNTTNYDIIFEYQIADSGSGIFVG